VLQFFLLFRLPYNTIFGGVTEFTKEQFTSINGFSNSKYLTLSKEIRA
jgi:hypothetical protein